MIRRTPIRKVSKKRARDMKAYSLLRAAFLKSHPFCQIWLKRQGYCEPEIIEIWDQCDQPERMFWEGKQVPFAQDIHHREHRGANYLNTDTWLAASRQQHEWVHSNPSEARRLGLLK